MRRPGGRSSAESVPPCAVGLRTRARPGVPERALPPDVVCPALRGGRARAAGEKGVSAEIHHRGGRAARYKFGVGWRSRKCRKQGGEQACEEPAYAETSDHATTQNAEVQVAEDLMLICMGVIYVVHFEPSGECRGPGRVMADGTWDMGVGSCHAFCVLGTASGSRLDSRHPFNQPFVISHLHVSFSWGTLAHKFADQWDLGLRLRHPANAI